MGCFKMICSYSVNFGYTTQLYISEFSDLFKMAFN